MKIQNLQKDTAYFGYEAHGFYLAANEVSREMPAAMAGNTYLRADVEAGRIRLLCDAADKNNLRAMELDLPTFDKPQKSMEAKPVVMPPRATVDLMKVELETNINGIGKLVDKVKYLEDIILKGKPQARGIAEDLLAPLKAQLVNDPSSHPKEVQPSEQKPIAPAVEIKANEPMINIGMSKPEAPETPITAEQDPVKEPTGKQVSRVKALAQMSKLELLKYATEIGCNVNPMTEYKLLKTAVADKEKELGYEAKK